MKNEEYIKQHPEQFKDDIDKWLFTEFGIIGGCCSAEKSHEYSVARMVAERYEKELVLISKAFIRGAIRDKMQMIEKACEWLKSYRQDTPDGTGYIPGIVNDKTIEDFKQAMEE
jgi:phage-related protein